MAVRAAIIVPIAGVLLFAATSAAATPPSEAVYRKLCRSIQTQHARALFVAPLAPIHLGGTSDCSFSAKGGNALVDGIQMFLRIDDGDQTLWKHRGDHLRNVPIVDGNRPARQVGLSGWACAVGGRFSHRHVHLHGHPG